MLKIAMWVVQIVPKNVSKALQIALKIGSKPCIMMTIDITTTNDDGDGGEVAALAIGAAALGAMGGYAAGESSAAQSSTTVYNAPPPSGYSSLPCTPNTSVVNGVNYYQCGASWYTQAYGNGGVVYMPVSAPQ
jgi:hypothetical protein